MPYLYGHDCVFRSFCSHVDHGHGQLLFERIVEMTNKQTFHPGLAQVVLSV